MAQLHGEGTTSPRDRDLVMKKATLLNLFETLEFLNKLEMAMIEIESGLHELKEAVKEMREDCREELAKEEGG